MAVLTDRENHLIQRHTEMSKKGDILVNRTLPVLGLAHLC